MILTNKTRTLACMLGFIHLIRFVGESNIADICHGGSSYVPAVYVDAHVFNHTMSVLACKSLKKGEGDILYLSMVANVSSSSPLFANTTPLGSGLTYVGAVDVISHSFQLGANSSNRQT